jgi:hypothetical protein
MTRAVFQFPMSKHVNMDTPVTCAVFQFPMDALKVYSMTKMHHPCS